MNYWILVLIGLCCNSLSCNNYFQDEYGCIHSEGIACRWEGSSNQCLQSSSPKLGCLNYLNQKACVAQTFYPNKKIAQCVFSGYCRPMLDNPDDCASNLSRAACLGISSAYCIWSNGCQLVSNPLTITSSDKLTAEMQQSSISICRLISGFPGLNFIIDLVIHQNGVHEVLISLYRDNIISLGAHNKFEEELLIPGCFIPQEEIYDKIACEASGLNDKGCMKVLNGKCIFRNGFCQTVSDMTTLECSDRVNKNACLSVTNFSQTCYWNDNYCAFYNVLITTECELNIQVSPSVCAKVSQQECFYDSATMQCNAMCRSQKNIQKATACTSSKYQCVTDRLLMCTFADGKQCDRLGQNQLACQNANINCHFMNGFCKSIDNINLLSCSSGLNSTACINLSNSSQVCKFVFNQGRVDGKCYEIQVTPEIQCEPFRNVNSNACKKITTGGCYWAGGECKNAIGTEECLTLGLNKIACLSTTNPLSPCKWNDISGSCEKQQVASKDNCTSLKLVNAVACRHVTFIDSVSQKQQFCRYNSSNFSCETFQMDDSINCSTAGLNQIACTSVSNSLLSCRWFGNQCVTVVTLGNAETCISLESVTQRTCSLIQTGTQKCKYDSIRQGCATSVPPTSECSTLGLNGFGCASLDQSCYFDEINYICKAANDAYDKIKCDVNWPSKIACLSITSDSQYCRWDSANNLCQLQIFPVSDSCSKFKNVNRKFCLAYEVSENRYVGINNYCTYDSLSKSCTLYSGSTLIDCGNNLDINLHACVSLSNPAKYCYFEYSTLKCTEMADTTSGFSLLLSLECKFANYQTCLKLQKSKIICAWSLNEKRCKQYSEDLNCTDFNSYDVNPSLCASTNNNTACRYDNTTKKCKEVLDTDPSYPCQYQGLNQKACLHRTNAACYFNNYSFRCLNVVSLVNAKDIRCDSLVNQKGCLASLNQPCYWSSNMCLEVTDVIFNAVQCASLKDKLYNATVCASVTTENQYCAYNSVTSQCIEMPIDKPISDCVPGYNYNTCQRNELCHPWDESIKICKNKQTYEYEYNCAEETTEDNCISSKLDSCVWVLVSLSCQKQTVDDNSTCDSFSLEGYGKYNMMTCFRINKSGEYCYYDLEKSLCKTVITDNNLCSTIGLNHNACSMKTKGHYCKFQWSYDDKMGCNNIIDIGQEQIQSIYFNIDACLKVNFSRCVFDLSKYQCEYYYSKEYTYYNQCSYYSDASKAFLYTADICKYSKGNDGCLYDSTTKLCKIVNTPLEKCSSNPNINQGYCLNYISNEICKFDFETGICYKFDPTNSDCNSCNSYKQCVNSAVSACQWVDACENVTYTSTCAELLNINSLACMAFANSDEKCQFQNGVKTSCIVPVDDTQNCSGLNKVACLANTANPCFYYLDQCRDITTQPFQNKCRPDYISTQAACVRIKTPEQFCMWDNNNCVPINILVDDTCEKYSSSIYSALVCASITTGNCYWNNGCDSGVALNCETLGANQGACIGAITGNCIFSLGVCIDVGNPTPIIQNKCSDPTNQGGCLNLNNGQPCKWNGLMCVSADLTIGCSTQINVNPGACSNTTDVACKWANSNCQIVITSFECREKGLNKIACTKFTSEYYCYYDDNKKQCDQIIDLNSKECTDNINRKACFEHQAKCCKWVNDECKPSTPASSCSALAENSYCCVSLPGVKCAQDTSKLCTISGKNPSCSYALNQEECKWIRNTCRWDTIKLQCLFVSNESECLSDMNVAACVSSKYFCKFLNNQCTWANIDIDSCADLTFSSLSSKKCQEFPYSLCQQGQNRTTFTQGCNVPQIDAACDPTLSFYACSENINDCKWDDVHGICTSASITEILPSCPDISVSLGYCSKSKSYCKQEYKYKSCRPFNLYDYTILCDDRNSVQPSQSIQCTVIEGSICLYDSSKIRCTSTISGTKCEIVINQFGCVFIQNNCYWDKSCKQYPDNHLFNSCEQIFSQYQCLINVYTACTWDNANNKCITYQKDITTCSLLTDQKGSPGICYFFSTDYCAHNENGCYLETAQSVCSNSKSPLGCKANSSGNCYWNIQAGSCSELTDIIAADMTCSDLKYSNKQFCVAPISEGQTCHWKNEFCLFANIEEITCTSDISLNACRAVARINEQCIFTSTCGYTTNTTTKCSDNLNIYGCLAVLQDGQYCKWLGQQCDFLIDDGYDLATHTLINANVCQKTYTFEGKPSSTMARIGVKYDDINYVCQKSDITSDLCNTPGLNYYGCLLTAADSCVWNGSKCTSFDFNVNYTQCEQYQYVSPKVCASILTEGIQCQHNSDTLSCEIFIETKNIFTGDQYKNSKSGMNRLACINVILQPTIWRNGICYYNQVKPAFTTCGKLMDVNAKSCAQIDKMDIICKYDNDGKCTTRFDGTIDTCTTPGLNQIGCVQIEKQRCIYINGSCQIQEQSDLEVCRDLKSVNALVCSQVINQPCKFSLVNRGCVSVFYSEKCNTEGINQLGCEAQKTCSWINQECYCKSQVQQYQLINCPLIPIEQCTIKQCIVSNKQCRNINCSDLTETQCSGATFGKIQCYLNHKNCTAASKCSDLFNVTCINFSFNGSKCATDLWITDHCVEQSCMHLTQDKCSGNCTWSSFQCVIKECNYMKKELCMGIMNNQQCYWDGSYCQALSTCQDYMNYQSIQTQTVCVSQTILNKQCQWKLIKPYRTDYECTSSICASQGNSIINCHGTETQNDVCILLPDYSCVACTEIKDSCTCMSFNYCQYNDRVGCFSNPCSNLSGETCVANVERCMDVNGECKPTCRKLKQADCLSRQTSAECHWNSDISKCLNGVEEAININTIADVIVIQNSYSALLMLFTIMFSIQ